MKDLAGKRIVVTRAAAQADEMVRLLESHGAIAVRYPGIAIAPPSDTHPLDESIAAANELGFDWLVVTSANTAEVLSGRLAPLPGGLRIAVVGRATARAVCRQLGVASSHVASPETGEGLAASLPLKPGDRVWLPQSERADGSLAAALTARGAMVTAVSAYRTVTGTGGADLPALLGHGEVDAVTFTSGSTAEHVFARLAAESPHSPDLTKVVLACLGATAAEALRRRGLHPVVAEQNTLSSLVTALSEHFAIVPRSAP